MCFSLFLNLIALDKQAGSLAGEWIGAAVPGGCRHIAVLPSILVAVLVAVLPSTYYPTR